MAKSWSNLECHFQSKILNSKLKFRGNEFELNKLQVLMGDRHFENFLHTHINQNVIYQVMQGEMLEMEDEKWLLTDGLLLVKNILSWNQNQKLYIF